MIQLQREEVEALDRLAGEGGVSRSAAARDAILRVLQERRRQRDLEAVVKAYAERPPERIALPRGYLEKIWPEFNDEG